MYRNNIGWGSVYTIDEVVDGQVDTYADLANLTDLFNGETSIQTQLLGNLVYFNNTGTNLTSDNVLDAIKEVNDKTDSNTYTGYWDS